MANLCEKCTHRNVCRYREPCFECNQFSEEVVRCKDCNGWCSEEIAKQYGVDRYCTMTMIPTNADDFCSYGERREDYGEQT